MQRLMPSRRWLLAAIVIVITVAAGVWLTRARARAAPPQPIAFSHQTHIENGLQCLYCHASALRSPVAGIPSVEKCMGCHGIIATDSEAIQAVSGYWERGEPIPWAQVNDQPDFVYFSHEPHTTSTITCEKCHGTVGSMTASQPVVEMDMGWCLQCHLDQPEEQVARLADCMACHK